jgi:hypothetical protein
MGYLTRNARFVYQVAGLCSLYMALVPLLSGGHGSALFIGFWIGAGLLLFAAIIPSGERRQRRSQRTCIGGQHFNNCDSVLRHSEIQGIEICLRPTCRGPYQPTTFDRREPSPDKACLDCPDDFLGCVSTNVGTNHCASAKAALIDPIDPLFHKEKVA